MPVYNLIEYSHNYSERSGELWQYYRDEPLLKNSDDFPGANNNSILFKFKRTNRKSWLERCWDNGAI